MIAPEGSLKVDLQGIPTLPCERKTRFQSLSMFEACHHIVGVEAL